ncbi:unnamed protein product [Adineta steineri]|uniref:Sema domain-containing protein n=3 Tax=Adineta steineri TaxID=433720 RepID=A0A818LFK2_9BILA|nr:unnamed protein product [Adineta steineri]
MLRNVQIYHDDDNTFDAITIDLQRDQIIIGAKNSIIRLSIHDFHLLEKFKWESTTNDLNTCRNQIQSLNECENYIRVLALRSRDQLLLTCGTNSYRPICTWRSPNSLSTIIPNENFISGDGKSPYNSQFPSTYDLIDTGELYSATSNEPAFGANDPLIQRSFTTEGKQLRTQQHDSNWLKNPYFVRILNIGSYVYTFFREVALEHLSCGPIVYSRVARVCKYDDGTMKYSDTFRSFSKLRLSCSKNITNDITSFDYNEVQSIFFDPSSNLIYGAFNLPKSGLSGSAICIYEVKELEVAFTSSYLSQKSNESYWLPSSSKQESEKCEPNQSSNIPSPSGPVLRSDVLQSSFDVLTLENIRIGHLLVDHFNGITIIFVITFDGLELRKYTLINNQLCLIEQIQLKPPDILDNQWKINKAEFISEKKLIVMTTTKSVIKIPVTRCARLNTSNLCIAAMDPYCIWDNNQQQCIIYTNSSSTYSFSHRSLSCPILNTTIDGGWTSWSSSFTCEQVTGEKCQCRTRTCTQPIPQFGGRLCHGSNVEIEKCEVHGGWSPWSEWSMCPKTCGKSFRSRTRTCTNPEPKNNGRICVGSEREEESCPEIICTNESLRLSAWSDWDTCSKSCGGGIQKRRRTCLINANNCSECLEETRLCQESPCPIQQATLWSDWTSTTNPMNDGSIAEKRTLFICTINSLSNKQLPEIKSDTVKYRVCDTHAINDCQETDSLDNIHFDNWSSWSVWSECYPSCGVSGSIETRRRTCLGKRCLGSDIEKRECLSCQPSLNSNWSCWTNWSDCSLCTSIRLRSIKSRTRMCLTNSCQGESREERLCSKCPLLSKSFSFIDSLNDNRFTLIHLILISLISFFLACFIMLCIFVICRRRCRQQHYRHRKTSNTFLHTDDRDYFQASTSNSSSSPHTAQDSDTFTTLSTTNNNTNKFRSFDSSSSSTTTGGGGSGGGVSAFLKEIPSRKLNMYINPREMPPLPPAATLKRTSLMSSMKTNLDADDL